MNKLPNDFLSTISAIPNCNHSTLLQSLSSEPVVSIRLNPLKKQCLSVDFLQSLDSIPWCNEGFYLKERPIFTLDPLFHAGAYYVQEASSMLAGYAFKQIFNEQKQLRVLDACAAPGGKTTHIATCLDETSLLVSNEIMRNRAMILSENVLKWGYPNTMVTNGDPKHFAKMGGYFDAILVDAPCSGEGMFRKDETAITDWSLANVQLCVERQKQILSDLWDSLKDYGYLFYSTCTFNPKENEEIARWVIDTLGAESIKIDIDQSWGITPCEYNGIQSLRCFPNSCRGEGFSLMVLQKTSNGTKSKTIKGNTFFSVLAKPIEAELKNYITQPSYLFVQNHAGEIFTIPKMFEKEIACIGNITKVVHAGTPIGSIKGKDIIPHPALALSTIINRYYFINCDISRETALQYLSRTNFNLQDVSNGWVLLTHKNATIGFVKNLGNRVNNSYPMEWRIRMNIL